MPQNPDLPDLGSYRAVHRAVRGGGHRLALAAARIPANDDRRVRALQRYWKGFANEVLVHHRLEDEIFFRALGARTPAIAGHLARLDTEHHELDRLMAEAAESIAAFGSADGPHRAAAALHRFATFMDDHLDLEDVDVLPLFERHFTGEEYRALEAKAFAAVGVGRQAAFTVPFVVRPMDTTERARTLGAAPLPMRVLHALTHRAHERLDQLVFAGTEAPTRRPEATLR